MRQRSRAILSGSTKSGKGTGTDTITPVQPEFAFKFIVLGNLPHYHGLIFQWDQDQRDPLLIVEWIFLSHCQSKNITGIQEPMAQLVRKARASLRELANFDFACLHSLTDLSGKETSPERLTKEMFEYLLRERSAATQYGKLQRTDLCPRSCSQIICF